MKTIAIDIDGTALKHPEKVNNLHFQKDTSVILHTSRPEFLRNDTVKELNLLDINYDALVMGKLKADYYIDDKNSNFELDYFGFQENNHKSENIDPDPVLLFSGGLDSFCLYHHIKKTTGVTPKIVYFHLGLPENDKELFHMKNLKFYNDIIVNKNFSLKNWKLDNEVLPFRNIHLLIGALHYGSQVYLGATGSSTNNDKTEEFCRMLENVAKYVSKDPDKNPTGLLEKNIQFLTPFAEKTKTQFIHEYIESGGDVDELLKTRSCYKGDDLECGKCASCIRKSVAFLNNNLPLKTEHKITIDDLENEYNRTVKIGQTQVATDTLNAKQILMNNKGI